MENTKTTNEVLVRTLSAGVHIGTLKSQEGTIVVLENARRLWKWAGAFTLNEVSRGEYCRKSSRICKPIKCIKLLQAIEIIPIESHVDLSTTEV